MAKWRKSVGLLSIMGFKNYFGVALDTRTKLQNFNNNNNNDTLFIYNAPI